MVFSYLISGVTSGALLATMGFMAGNPLWSVFVLYTLGGSLGIVGLAALICILPRNAAASTDVTGPAEPDGIKA